MSQPAISLAMLPLGASGPAGTPKTLTFASTVDGDIVINEPTTSILTIAGLVTLNGRLIVRAHPLLTEIVTPTMEHCEGVEICGNNSLANADLGALTSASGTLKFILN